MRKPREINRNGLLSVSVTGVNGGFSTIRIPGRWSGTAVWSFDENGLEHVTVSPYTKGIVPDWEDTCLVRDIFWPEDEIVVQIHPAKREYINVPQNCLHLWRDKAGMLNKALEATKGKI